MAIRSILTPTLKSWRNLIGKLYNGDLEKRCNQRCVK